MNEKPKFKIPKIESISTDESYSFEYKTIGYSIMQLQEMIRWMSETINNNAESGYRYIESIRVNPSEGILIFERKK